MYLSFKRTNQDATISINRHFSLKNGTGYPLRFYPLDSGITIEYSYNKNDWWTLAWNWNSKISNNIQLNSAHNIVYFRGTLNKAKTNLITFIIDGGEVSASGGPHSLYTKKENFGPEECLPPYCFCAMFSGCTNLVNAPNLDYQNLSIGCYMSMFEGCTNLKKAPILPAKVIPIRAYQNMFKGCSNLKFIQTNMIYWEYNSLYGWVDGVGSNGTFTHRSDMSSFTTLEIPLFDSGMNWTNETEPEILPFTKEDCDDSLVEHQFSRFKICHINPNSLVSTTLFNVDSYFYHDGNIFDTFYGNEKDFIELFLPGILQITMYDNSNNQLFTVTVPRRSDGKLKNYYCYHLQDNEYLSGTYKLECLTEIGTIIDKYTA